jgi:chromosome segregation ATPase
MDSFTKFRRDTGTISDINGEIAKMRKIVEDETSKRKEYESIITKINKSHKDLFQKYLGVEQELTQQMKVSENLQDERKEAVDTLLSERELWKNEREQLETQLAQLSLEAAEARQKEKKSDEQSEALKTSVENHKRELEQYKVTFN